MIKTQKIILLSRASSDSTKMISDSKFSMLINDGMCLGESLKYFSEIAAILHRDNSELIFFIDPDKECLLGVVEDSSRFRPC